MYSLKTILLVKTKNNGISQVPAVCTCNLGYLEGRDQRVMVQNQLGQIVPETISGKTPSK
jgi:hypothetical protein